MESQKLYLWELFLHDQKHESWVDMAASPHCNPFPYMEAASRKPQQSNDTFSTVHDSYELLLLDWWLGMQLSRKATAGSLSVALAVA